MIFAGIEPISLLSHFHPLNKRRGENICDKMTVLLFCLGSILLCFLLNPEILTITCKTPSNLGCKEVLGVMNQWNSSIDLTVMFFSFPVLALFLLSFANLLVNISDPSKDHNSTDDMGSTQKNPSKKIIRANKEKLLAGSNGPIGGEDG